MYIRTQLRLLYTNLISYKKHILWLIININLITCNEVTEKRAGTGTQAKLTTLKF